MFRDTKAFSGFSVDSILKAREFYESILGIECSEEYGMLWLHIAGGTTIFVYEKPNHIPAIYTILNFPVENIDEAADALMQKGVTLEYYENTDKKGIARGIANHMGPDIAWFKDPAGNILSILQRT